MSFNLNNIRLMFWNAQGINNTSKQMQLNSHVSTNNFDIVLIAETFLNDQHTFLINNFDVYRSDRASHEGGVIIAIKYSTSIYRFY